MSLAAQPSAKAPRSNMRRLFDRRVDEASPAEASPSEQELPGARLRKIFAQAPADEIAQGESTRDVDAADRRLRILMRYLSQAGLIVNALLTSPRADAPAELMQESAEQMLGAAKTLADTLYTETGFPDQPRYAWARYRLTRIALHAVAREWQRSDPDKHEETFNPMRWLPVLLAMQRAELPDVDPRIEFPDINDEFQVELAYQDLRARLIEQAYPLLALLEGEAQGRAPEPIGFVDAVVTRAENHLRRAVERAYLRQLEVGEGGAMASQAVRTTLLCSLVRQAGGIYAEVMRTERLQLTGETEGASNEARRWLRERSSKRLDPGKPKFMDRWHSRVEQQFDRMFGALVKFTLRQRQGERLTQKRGG